MDQAVKQSPHVFIPALCLPVDEPTIDQLERSRARLVPTRHGSRHVYMDDTGYFVTFPGGKQGRYQQAMWLRTNERTIFSSRRLDSMESFPDGQPDEIGSFKGQGRSDAGTAALIQYGEPLIDDANNAIFDIRGAASIGATKPVRLQKAGADEFAIRGAAASSSSHSKAKCTPAHADLPAKGLQHAGKTGSSLSYAPSTDLFVDELPMSTDDLRPQCVCINDSKQDRDDATSSTSGVARSDVSSSKSLECHVCHGRNGSLFKCSCNRRYHRHCHTDPPIPQQLSSDWQCRRCMLKGVSRKRARSELPSPVSDTHKKQRLASDDVSGPKKTSNTSPVAFRLAANDQPALAGISQQQSEFYGKGAVRAAVSASDSQSGLLDDALQADNLVVESSTIASGAAASKAEGASKAFNISMPESQSKIDRPSSVRSAKPAGDPASVSASSNGVARTTRERRSTGLDNEGISINKSSRLPINMAPGLLTTFGRRSKPGRMKCTACSVRVVPSNPFNRTICQTCKEEAEAGKALSEADDCVAALKPETSQTDGPASETDSAITMTATAAASSVIISDHIMPPASPSNDPRSARVDVAGEFIDHSQRSAERTSDLYSFSANRPTANHPVAAHAQGFDDSLQSQPESRRNSAESVSSVDTDEDDVPLSSLAAKRAMEPMLRGLSPAVKKGRTRQTQTVEAENQYDLGNSLKRPKGTYARLIHMAISDAPDNRLRSYEVIQWISRNIPNYKLGQGTWASGVKSTLIFKSDTSGENGKATLRRTGPGGSESWYELLPHWKNKVERWDATLSQPVPPLTNFSGHSTQADKVRLVDKHAETLPSTALKRKSPGLGSFEGGNQEAQSKPLGDEMGVDGDVDVDFDIVSSDEEPLAKLRADRQRAAEEVHFHSVLSTGVSVGATHQAVCNTQKGSSSFCSMTVAKVLPCHPSKVQTKFHQTWPSLDPKHAIFDYDAKRAEIKARTGRKAQFAQKKRPVDVEKMLAVVGPSRHIPWPPIDNSLGLAQEQLGDEMTVVL